ncbi:MAG: NFACT RNA binding domain-containing protein [Eubacteriales bacterium]|nr:NFACT RNA binding domain-containing protein [Eubacteriales bacterium]
MPLDGISADFLRAELATSLVGARLNQVWQTANLAIYLQLRKPGHSLGLHISINPAQAALYLDPKTPPRLADQSNFLFSLKKRLQGAELIGVEGPDCERIFHLHFRGSNEIGDLEDHTLIAEIMGKHSNLVLVRQNGIIHDSFRHIDSSVNRYREIMPARPYLAPPPQDKLFFSSFLKDLPAYLQGEKILPFLEGEGVNMACDRYLVARLAGFSPLLAQDVCFQAGLEEKLQLQDLSPSQLSQLSRCLAELFQKLERREYRPALYYVQTTDREAKDFYSLPLHIFPRWETYPSLSATLAAFYSQKSQAESLGQLRRKIDQKLKRLQKTHARRYQSHLNDLQEGEKAATYKLYGDLLQAKIYQIPPKAQQVQVENYYEPDLPLIEIPLDPALSPAQNVNHYYKLYRKAKEKARWAATYLRQDEWEGTWLDNLQVLLDRMDSLEDGQAILEELREQKLDSGAGEGPQSQTQLPLGQILNPGKPSKKGKYKAPPQAGKKRKTKKDQEEAVTAGWREFKTSEGFLVQVGRNNLANDRLTFKKARKDDLWFHARNMPGSHTILRLEGQAATDRAIEEAASIAAYFSSGNLTGEGSKLEVDYCPVKQVSRIPGAKPGLVTYKNFKTAYVEAKLPSV